MVTKLELMNKALGHLGTLRLTTLTENRPERRELDATYAGVKQAMLERGIWYFALRTIRIEADPDFDPDFGQRRVFTMPADLVRLRAISSDENLIEEDKSYRREGRRIISDYDTLYLSYVSNDDSYGGDLGKYTELYAEAFGAEWALKSALPISKDRNDRNDLIRISKMMLLEAKRVEAVDERTKFKPVGTWVQSRWRYNVGNRQIRRQST